MDNRAWESGAAGSPPSAPGSPSVGYPTAGDPQTATPATKPGPYWFHQIGEELRAVLTAAGITPSTANNAQLLEAIQRLIDAQSGNYALDTGAANAYVVALSPAITAYTDGMTVRVKAINANTGASTLNAGGGVVALVNDVGDALANGDIPAASIFTATYIASAGKFYITSMVQSQGDARYALKGANSDITSLSALTSINGGQLAGLRNRVINGRGQIQQRPSSTNLSATEQYFIDRHIVLIVGGTVISGSAGQTSGISGMDTGYAMGTQNGSWTNGMYTHIHRIEAENSIDLTGKTITVSCKVFQNTGGVRNFKIYLYTPTTTKDTFGALTQIAVSGNLAVPDNLTTAISATFAGLGNVAKGAQIIVQDAVANTVVGKYYLVGDLQLEIGAVATPFEQRSIGLELALCQRYYEVLGGEAANDVELATYNAAAASCYITLPYKVQKRVQPTVSKIGTWTVSNCGQPLANAAGTKGCLFGFSATALGACYAATTGSTTYITADSEL